MAMEARKLRPACFCLGCYEKRAPPSLKEPPSIPLSLVIQQYSEVLGLLNIRAESNVMTRKVIEDASLAMRRGCRLELVSYTRHNRPFLGFCEDVKVGVCGLGTRHRTFAPISGLDTGRQ